MRRIMTATCSFALALSLSLAAEPAQAAVAGYDSAYSGESAFVHIAPGQTQNFQVFFTNTGTTTWVRGTGTQIDLAACLGDKVTCNAQDASEAPWNNGWRSPTRYATTVQTTVAPGAIATFTYNITAPVGVTAGTYRFNGDLVLAATGEKIHPEGYYQDATVGTSLGSTSTTYSGTAGGFISGAGTASAPEGGTVTGISASWVNPSSGSSGSFACSALDANFNQATENFTCSGNVPGIATNTVTITTIGSYSNGSTSTETDIRP
jgi:hypothetical protein